MLLYYVIVLYFVYVVVDGDVVDVVFSHSVSRRYGPTSNLN